MQNNPNCTAQWMLPLRAQRPLTHIIEHWNQMVKTWGVFSIIAQLLTGHWPSFSMTGHLVRCYSALFGLNEQLFELTMPYSHLEPVCPSHINRAFLLPLTEHLCFGPFPVNPRDGCMWKNSFWNRPAFQAPTTSCIQSRLNPLSSPFWGSAHTSASCLDHA